MVWIGSRGRVRAAAARLPGCRWSRPVTLAGGRVTHGGPTVAVDRYGDAIATWNGSAVAAAVRRGPGGRWAAVARLGAGGVQQAALGPRGLAVAVWQRPTAHPSGIVVDTATRGPPARVAAAGKGAAVLARAAACLCTAASVVACGSSAQAPRLGTAPVLRSLSECPARLAKRPFGSAGGGLGERLVPAGATRARLCVYAGLNPKPRRFGRLRAQRVVTGRAALAGAAAKLNSLPAPRSGAHSCPGRPRTPFVVIFGYAGRPPVAVTVYVPGTCFLVSNGVKVADASYVSADPVMRLLRRG